MKISITRYIDAPIKDVFNAISNHETFASIIPEIVDMQALNETKGLGAKFSETREMNGKRMTLDFTVTEYEENKLIRLESEYQGTIWDSLFTFAEDNGRVNLTMTMEAKAKNFMANMMFNMMKPMMKKSIGKDFDLVKEYLEK